MRRPMIYTPIGWRGELDSTGDWWAATVQSTGYIRWACYVDIYYVGRQA